MVTPTVMVSSEVIHTAGIMAKGAEEPAACRMATTVAGTTCTEAVLSSTSIIMSSEAVSGGASRESTSMA